MQGGKEKRANKTSDHAADRDLVRNDEVFKIDKRRCNKAGQEKTINQRQRRRDGTESQPARQEDDSREQFDQEIANGNWRPAITALAPQIKPRDQWHVQIPWKDRK